MRCYPRLCLWVALFSALFFPSKLFSLNLPMLYDGCTVRVAAQVEGKSAYLIFDTGSTISALDKTVYQSQLGEPVAEVRASSISGLTNMSLYRSPEIVLGSMVEYFERIAVVDLSRIDAISGSECDGVLGADFAQRHVVSINFDRQSIEVENEFDNKQPSDTVRLDLKPVGNGNFAVDANVDGVPVSLMIDTGDNGSISLNAEDWRRVTRADRDAKVHTILASPISGAPVQSAAFRLHDLTVGSNHYRGFVATRIPNSHSPSTLGLRFLRQHLVRFDFQHRQLFLKSGAEFGETEVFDMSGLHLIRSNGVTLVYAVDSGSPADTIAIHPGDIVESVNDTPADHLSMRDIRRSLKSADGGTVTLAIRRGMQTADEHLLLRKVL